MFWQNKNSTKILSDICNGVIFNGSNKYQATHFRKELENDLLECLYESLESIYTDDEYRISEEEFFFDSLQNEQINSVLFHK